MPNEPPTLAGEDAHLLLRHAEDCVGERAAHAEDALAADMEVWRSLCGRTRRSPRAAPSGSRRRGCCESSSRVDVRRPGEGGGDLGAVAEVVVEHEVAGHLVVELRRAGRRRLGGS